MSIYFTFALTFFIAMSVLTVRVVITLYALKLGAQPFTVGVLAAMFSVLPTMLSWQVGQFSDRFGSRWLILFGTGVGILGMLAAYLVPGLPTLFLASIMSGLLFTVSVPPLQTLVGLQSSPQDNAKNFSNYSLVVSFTGSAGPLLAGFAIDHAGPGAAFLSLVILLLPPAAMLLVRGGKLPRSAGAPKTKESVRVLLSESGLWRVLATSSLVITGVDLFQIYMPVYGHEIGLSASTIGVILALYSLAAFVVRIFLPSLIRRFTVEKALAYSFLIGATGFMLVPLFENIMVLSAVSFFFGLGMGCGQPITLMMTFSNATGGRSGEAMGLRVTVNYLTRVVGQVLFGSIGSAFGVPSVFWVNALMLASGWAVSHPRVSGGNAKGVETSAF